MLLRRQRLAEEEKDQEAYRLFREAELAEAHDPDLALGLFKKCARTSPALAAIYGL